MPTDVAPTMLVSGFGLLEAARWHPQHGLVFSDMTQGGVYHLSGDGSTPEGLIPHRKAIGGLVAHVDGGLVISGRNIAWKAPDGGTEILHETGTDEGFFNDLTADGRGRLFVGSMPTRAAENGADQPSEDTAGRLYQLETTGVATVIADDVLISNGLAADPTDTALYHVDSGRKLIWRFTLADRAPASNRQAFIDTSEYPGLPDGLAVASDGSLWVAIAGAGVVVGWDGSGDRIAEIAVPAALVTSVCFGGADLDRLYILTGVNAEYPHPAGGSVFRMPAPRIGLPAPLARARSARP